MLPEWLQWVLLALGGWLVVSSVLRLTGGYAPGWRVRCGVCGRCRPAAEHGVVRIGAFLRKRSLMAMWCGGRDHLRLGMVEPAPAEPPVAGAPS